MQCADEACAVLPGAQSLANRGAEEALLPGAQGLASSGTDEGELINISSDSSSDEEDEIVTAGSNAISTSSSEVLTTNCPNGIAQTAAFPPAQPANIRFPTTMISSKARSFNPAWYGMHNWLEYSVERDACFCYPCRLFGTQSSQFGSHPRLAFTVKGFRNWKHATGKRGVLICHTNCASHKQALVAWNQYNLNHQLGSIISDQMGSNLAEAIHCNRHYLKTTVEVILLRSKQGLALHGHRESANRGHFKCCGKA